MERCNPSEADWYVEVIYGLPNGGNCDYSYDYFRSDKRPTRAFARRALVPEGNIMLECRIQRCG